MEIFYVILILLIVARFFGEIAERLKQPALLGELLAGILLGYLATQFSDAFSLLQGLEENETFIAITDLGIFFLMLYAGIELQPMKVISSTKKAIWIALGGMILPFVMGIGTGAGLFPESDQKNAQVLFIGVVLAITAIPVAVKVLMDVNMLNNKVGQSIVSSAVIDDVISLVLLAILTAMMRTGEAPVFIDLLILAGKIIGFFIITGLSGFYLLPLIEKWINQKLQTKELEFSLLLIVAFAFAVFAEIMSMHFIIGAFMAGLFFSRRRIQKEVYEDVESKVGAVTTGFLAPIFFASIGLHLKIEAIANIPLFLAGFIMIAFAGKVIGAGIPSYLLGFSKKDSLIIGFSMNGRGAVELIIVDIAYRAGLFQTPDHPLINNLFSAVVVMAIITTLATPVALKLLVGNKKNGSEANTDH